MAAFCLSGFAVDDASLCAFVFRFSNPFEGTSTPEYCIELEDPAAGCVGKAFSALYAAGCISVGGALSGSPTVFPSPDRADKSALDFVKAGSLFQETEAQELVIEDG
jgi:hypothetical protein